MKLDDAADFGARYAAAGPAAMHAIEGIIGRLDRYDREAARDGQAPSGGCMRAADVARHAKPDEIEALCAHGFLRHVAGGSGFLVVGWHEAADKRANALRAEQTVIRGMRKDVTP